MCLRKTHERRGDIVATPRRMHVERKDKLWNGMWRYP